MLDQPVENLPGVGRARTMRLHVLGLYTVKDILFSFPREYWDFTKVHNVDDLAEGMECLVCGRVTGLREQALRGGKRLITAQLAGTSKTLTTTWFSAVKGRGASYLYKRLQGRRVLWLYGTVKKGVYGLEMANGEWYAERPPGGLHPVYPLTQGITQKMRRRWAACALQHLHELYERLPGHVLNGYLGRQDAIASMHFPRSLEEQQAARTRLVFEEFFLFQLGLHGIDIGADSVAHRPDGTLIHAFLKALPFSLTAGQRRALEVIAQDMESQQQMRRLLQGDVGSGKTVVAMYAAVKAVESRGQAAIMVPTEVLARQMAGRVETALKPLGISTALLTGNINSAERRKTLQRIEDGGIHVAVGTHALITDQVRFHRLTLAVVDEQHRFGVRQRLALSDKGHADLLVMSATPIPRSLALTVYGDLDTILIPDKPAGRHDVDTRLIHPNNRTDVYRFVRQRVHCGEQAFVVFPLIEESEKIGAKAVVQEAEYLRTGPLSGLRVAVLHGQMAKDKDAIMEAFASGEYDVLVSTTVIEVGMNVPRATVMVIENAERFGLAQLHQLRGRVGRSHQQAYCLLLADLHSGNGKNRLQVLRDTTDGLAIAEQDLAFRGPGDLLGVRQSGEPWFRLADIIRDRAVLEKAAAAAKELLRHDGALQAYPTLREELDHTNRKG